MRSKRKKEYSTTELFEMTGGKFEETHGQLDRIEKRLDLGFETLSGEVKTAKRDILAAVAAIHDVKQEALERRVARLEKKLGIAA